MKNYENYSKILIMSKITSFILSIAISLSCFSQLDETNTVEIINSTPSYMGQDDLPKDLINKCNQQIKLQSFWQLRMQRKWQQ